MMPTIFLILNKKISIRIMRLFIALLSLLCVPIVYANNEFLTIQQAEQLALDNEPGIVAQQWQVKALSEKAIADGQLADPQLQLGISNLPTDSFAFDQENMTQFKVGIAQRFPAGDSLKIKQQKTLADAKVIETKTADRKLMIIKKVRLHYLEIYYWERAYQTIVENKQFFSQLVNIVQSLFTLGRNNQQDLIRAQLELDKLDERLNRIKQKIYIQRYQLSRWIGEKAQLPLQDKLPKWQLPTLDNQQETLIPQFFHHPQVQIIDKQLAATRQSIALAKEQYKSAWGVNVNYAYRDNAPNGRERADFISAGVSIDLPLFTQHRQDKSLLAKEYQYQALKDKRLETLRQLVAQLQEELASEMQLSERHQLYNTVLLPKSKQQSEAALLAYQSDRGDFADVMRAYIDDLNIHLEEKRLAVDHLKSKAKILYFTAVFSTNNRIEY